MTWLELWAIKKCHILGIRALQSWNKITAKLTPLLTLYAQSDSYETFHYTHRWPLLLCSFLTILQGKDIPECYETARRRIDIKKKRKLKVILTTPQLYRPTVKWSIICQQSAFGNISCGSTAHQQKNSQLQIRENKPQYNLIFKGLCEKKKKMHEVNFNSILACAFIIVFKSHLSWKDSTPSKKTREEKKSTQYFKRLSHFFMDYIAFRLD